MSNRYGDMYLRLQWQATKGADLSPGDPVAAWAVAEIDRLREYNTVATAELRTLRAALLTAKRTHHYCEDSWYSCPKSEEGCSDYRAGRECNCGADAHNAAIEAAVAPAVSCLDGKIMRRVCTGCNSVTCCCKELAARPPEPLRMNDLNGTPVTTCTICEGCGNEIDPDYCSCGEPIQHSPWVGHPPVPMGCDCMRVTK